VAAVLILVAVVALAASDRITGEASAVKPDRALNEIKAPKADPVPVAAPAKPDKVPGALKPPKPPKGGPGKSPVVSTPPRAQSVDVPAPAPAQSTPPTGQAAAPGAPAAPTTLTGDRPAAGRRRTRNIRLGNAGGGTGRVRRVQPGAASSRGSNVPAAGDRSGARRFDLLSGAAPSTRDGRADGKGNAPSGRPADKPEKDAGGSPVVRTVKDIVEVVPKPVKILLGVLAAISALLGAGYLFVAGRARRLDRQRAELLQEVGLLQTALLPPVPGTVGAVRTSVAYRPSDGPGAGGDFYDALTLPGGKAAFILGDVSGHGRQSLARTAFARFTLRAYLEAGLEPRTALQVAGRVIDQHLDGHFATVVIAVHDPADGSLTYACAGHPAPIVVGPTRPEPILAASAPPIGLELPTGVRQTTLPLPPGSVVCLYTDGLAESRTEEGILGRPRLADIVAELGRGATASGLLKAVAKEARLVTDDMATVLISPTAGVTSGGFRSEQLEVTAEEAESGLAERFLEACEVRTARLREAASEARSLAADHGGAVLHVRFGPRGAQVEVLPRNVESLEAASQRSAAHVG